MSRVKEVRLRSEIPGEDMNEPPMKKQKCESEVIAMNDQVPEAKEVVLRSSLAESEDEAS